MPSPWSLVAFTLLVQTAVGSLWQTLIILLLVREPLASGYFQSHACFLLVLMGISLISAMSHLGKPLNSLNSARNVTRSWLSKEIISVNIFVGVLGIVAAVAVLFKGASQSMLMLCGSLAGGSVLYAMIRIYLIKTVPSWNHMGTPLTFIGSACLLGGLPGLILLPVVGSAIPAAQGMAVGAVAIGGSLFGIAFKILAAKSSPRGTCDQRELPILQLAGVGMLILTQQVDMSGSGVPYLFALPVVLISVGECLNRKRFYESYCRVGL